MPVVRKIAGIVFRSKEDTRDAVVLLVLMAIAAALEVLGIGLVIPFVSVIDRPDILEKSTTLHQLSELTGLRGRFGAVVLCGSLLALIFIVKNAFLYFVQHRQYAFSYGQQVTRSGELLAAYLRRPWTFHLQNNSAELTNTVVYEVAIVYQHIVIPSFQLLVESISVLVIAALLVALEPVIIPGVALALGVMGFLFFRSLRRRANALGDRMRKKQVEMVTATQQGFGGVKEIRILGVEGFFIDAFDRSGKDYGRSLVIHGSVSILPRYVLETGGVVTLVLITVAMFARGSEPRDVLPVLGALAVAAVRLLPSMARILGAVAAIRFHLPELDVLTKAFGASGSDATTSRKAPAPALPFERELRLRDFTYSYPETTEAALRGVSLVLKRGESVGLVGPSGSGKTTLADVLVGLLSPVSGTFEVDGKVVKGDTVREWQRNIGYISQSIFLCDDTIRRNVAFGVEDADIDEAKVKDAIEAAQLEEFIASLPDGLDTIVGERGARLSGGQRQRIGIARALYRSPPVLVLDEATSALDGATEREVVEAIERVRADRTTIVVAHRLSTVRNCDRIVLVSEGKIADIGSWDELTSRNTDFQQMVRAAQLEPAAN